MDEEFELPDGSYSVSDIQLFWVYHLKTWDDYWKSFNNDKRK